MNAQTAEVLHKDQKAQTGEFVIVKVINWDRKPTRYCHTLGGVYDPEKKTWLIRVTNDTHRNHLRVPSIYGLGIIHDARKDESKQGAS